MERRILFERIITSICLALSVLTGMAQTPRAGEVEVFAGAELNYADVNFVRLYNVLINMTPGVKWHLGHDWLVSGQAFIPVYNDGYQNKHNVIRLTNAALAKQLHFGNQHFKVTGGLFGYDRYGLDLRWMYPVTSWLMFNAQAGYTGEWRLALNDATDWGEKHEIVTTKSTDFGSLDRFSGIVGANVWLEPWHTELRLSCGRYIGEEYGVQAEIMRHFPGCTVELYAQYHERAKTKWAYREGGGFKVIMLLPDKWKWKSRKVTLRPASNFRLTYNAQADVVSMKMYTTDPEENERTYPVRIPWGTGNLKK